MWHNYQISVQIHFSMPMEICKSWRTMYRELQHSISCGYIQFMFESLFIVQISEDNIDVESFTFNCNLALRNVYIVLIQHACKCACSWNVAQISNRQQPYIMHWYLYLNLITLPKRQATMNLLFNSFITCNCWWSPMRVTWSASCMGIIASGSVAMAASSIIRCVGLMLSTTRTLLASLQVQNTVGNRHKM